MEKIKLMSGVPNTLIIKINEIIDWVKKIGKTQSSINDLHEDRLKTLEDKVEFIMENTAAGTTQIKDDIKLISLQDLWDEENEEHLEKEVIKEFIKPTVKKCDGYCGNDAKCECKHTTEEIVKIWNKPTDNSEKIEEIISAFNKWFDSDKKRAVELYSIDDIKRFKQDIESWLRDKLKN